METYGLRYSARLFENCSMFLLDPSPDDIECERQALEARYGEQLKVFEIETLTVSGKRRWRVTWECL